MSLSHFAATGRSALRRRLTSFHPVAVAVCLTRLQIISNSIDVRTAQVGRPVDTRSEGGARAMTPPPRRPRLRACVDSAAEAALSHDAHLQASRTNTLSVFHETLTPSPSPLTLREMFTYFLHRPRSCQTRTTCWAASSRAWALRPSTTPYASKSQARAGHVCACGRATLYRCTSYATPCNAMLTTFPHRRRLKEALLQAVTPNAVEMGDTAALHELLKVGGCRGERAAGAACSGGEGARGSGGAARSVELVASTLW